MDQENRDKLVYPNYKIVSNRLLIVLYIEFVRETYQKGLVGFYIEKVIFQGKKSNGN